MTEIKDYTKHYMEEGEYFKELYKETFKRTCKYRTDIVNIA